VTDSCFCQGLPKGFQKPEFCILLQFLSDFKWPTPMFKFTIIAAKLPQTYYLSGLRENIFGGFFQDYLDDFYFLGSL